MRLFDKYLSIESVGGGLGFDFSATFNNDSGPKITVEMIRSMEAEPDRAVVKIWNLPAEIANRLAKAARDLRNGIDDIQERQFPTDEDRFRAVKRTIERYQIGVFGGLGVGNARGLMFLGDPIQVKPRIRDGLDYYTEIHLGDAFVVLNEIAAAGTLGLIPATEAFLKLSENILALNSVPDITATLQRATVNAADANIGGDVMIVGRPLQHINGVMDLLDLRWWVKDGKLQFVRRGQALQDFIVRLDERENLLSCSEPEDNGYIEFEAFATPALHPGRGVRLIREGRQEYTRVIRYAKTSLDTHGDAWKVVGRCAEVRFDGQREVIP